MFKSLVISRWSLVIIIIVAAFFRLYNIAELPPGLYPDEAMNGNNALEALSPNGQFKWFYPENNGREGLFINIQALSIYTFGNEPWALRLISAIFGILTVLGVYFLAKELFRENLKFKILNPKQNQNLNNLNSKIALLSSFFLAINFWHINFSRIGFRAIMAPLFLTWGIYFLIKTLNSLKTKNYKLKTMLGGLIYGLGFHSYIAYRVTPLLILIIIALYWLQNKDWQIRKKILLVVSGYTLMALVAFAPLGLYFLQHPQDFFGRTTQVSVFNSPTPLKDLGINIAKTAGMFNFSGDWNWRHNIAGQPLLFWPIGILFIIGIILGLKKLIDINRDSLRDIYRYSFIILFSWIIIASLPIIISNEGLPHALRAILMIPPVFILAGVGGVWLYKKMTYNLQPTTYNALLIAICLLLIGIVINAYYSYFIKWGKNPNVQGAFAQNYVDIGRQLNALPKELPKYVVVKAGGVDVRGLPMPTQTTMFITDTFTPEKRKENNIFYVLPNEIDKIPQGAYTIILD